MPTTRQNKDRDARGAIWIRDLRHFYSEVANRHLELAGVEKRYDPRSYKDGGVDKIPEKHLGPKLAAMERQGYASREGVHNGKIDADRQLVQVLRTVPAEPPPSEAAHRPRESDARPGGR